MSKTMPDFSDNGEEEFDDPEFAESTNLQLNSADKDDEEDFALDDADDEDEEDDQLKKLKATAREIDAEASRLRELQAALKKANGASSNAEGGDGDSDHDDDMADSGLNNNNKNIPGLGAAGEEAANGSPKEAGSPAAAAEEGGEEQGWDPDEADARSIFAKNVDYSSEANEINTFFSSCGAIERLTILTDKMTGRPKGCAYIQFKSKEAVESALALDGAMFKGRALSIAKKHRTLPPHKLRRRRRRRRRFNPYYSYGYVPYYPRRRRRTWAPY